ncbi:MAG: hypothetical protein ACOVQR_04185 [Flavobacterium sp.]|uniref:hypothetical protein n=1 Tax=Flavobacterium sp. TaxID=239 RepID=UPI003BA3F36D
MKYLFIYLIVTLFSCNGNSQVELKKNSFMGNWSFIIVNGYNCYTCPKIEFTNEDKGNLKLSETIKIEFIYKIMSDNKIEFTFSKGNKQSLFKQSEIFYYEIQKEGNFEYIDLLDANNKQIIHSLITSIK